MTEPTDAELGRTLLTAAAVGTLATVSVDGGIPFGSVVVHAVDDRGRPLLCLSDLAEHSRNLAADPRASLMAAETGSSDSLSPGGADPLALARVTVLGAVAVLAGAERDAALATYLDRHPGAFHTGYHDFRMYRLEVTSVRYVGGFGRMSWVSAADHTGAEPDPLRPHAADIVEHMNADHAEALVAYCRAFGNRPATTRAEMTGVDRYGFTVRADGEHDVRVPFGRRTDTSTAVRAAMIKLLREARTSEP